MGLPAPADIARLYGTASEEGRGVHPLLSLKLKLFDLQDSPACAHRKPFLVRPDHLAGDRRLKGRARR